MNYYCLIAGLPDVHPEDMKVAQSIAVIKQDLLEELTHKDAALLRLLFSSYDNENLLAYLRNKDAELNELGNLDKDDWEQLIALMRDDEKPSDPRLLPYIHKYYMHTLEEDDNEKVISKEDFLASLYFEYAMKSENQFLRNWFEFNLNLNNLLAAIACRKFGYDIKSMVLGDNEIARTLRNSNARDFSLTGVFHQLELVLRIAEEENLLERERKLDALRWDWLEENTFFNYFSIEKVLAYVLRVEMIERWKMLTFEKGSEIFRNLLRSLKDEVKLK